jgi:alpha-beta hydrolase superfamily lysophospholipase
VPFLALHGEQDEAVSAESASRLVEWAASSEKDAVRIPNTGHTFGAAHPWAGPTPAWERVVAETSDWFGRWLAD